MEDLENRQHTNDKKESKLLGQMKRIFSFESPIYSLIAFPLVKPRRCINDAAKTGKQYIYNYT